MTRGRRSSRRSRTRPGTDREAHSSRRTRPRRCERPESRSDRRARPRCGTGQQRAIGPSIEITLRTARAARLSRRARLRRQNRLRNTAGPLIDGTSPTPGGARGWESRRTSDGRRSVVGSTVRGRCRRSALLSPHDPTPSLLVPADAGIPGERRCSVALRRRARPRRRVGRAARERRRRVVGGVRVVDTVGGVPVGNDPFEAGHLGDEPSPAFTTGGAGARVPVSGPAATDLAASALDATLGHLENVVAERHRATAEEYRLIAAILADAVVDPTPWVGPDPTLDRRGATRVVAPSRPFVVTASTSPSVRRWPRSPYGCTSPSRPSGREPLARRFCRSGAPKRGGRSRPVASPSDTRSRRPG